MKQTGLIYMIWIGLITYLFYSENFGINALLLSIASGVVFAYLDRKQRLNTRWGIGFTLHLVAGVAVFLQSSIPSVLLYFFTFFYFAYLRHQANLMGILTVPQIMQSGVLGVYYFFVDVFTFKDFEGKTKSIIKRLIIGIIFVGVIITFLKLYQTADKTFYTYTAWINLEWISFPVIAFYVFISIFLYGLFFFKAEEHLTKFEQELKLKVPQDYEDSIQKYFTIESEQKMAVGLLLMLNAMLVLYNLIDINFVTSKLYQHAFDQSLSELVHGGINALIFSLVLVILLITYLFRGQLNFTQSTWGKRLAFIWLAQNLVMISTTLLKNWEYVLEWGLTYKRIGVFVYLTLACIGILFTFYKLAFNQSIWFLFRKVVLSFFAFFVIFSCFNWASIITHYNLSHLEKEKIDFNYLLSLGEDATPDLLEYHVKEGIQNEEFLNELLSETFITRETLEIKFEELSWKSYNLREEKLLKELRRYKLPENLEYSRNW